VESFVCFSVGLPLADFHGDLLGGFRISLKRWLGLQKFRPVSMIGDFGFRD
jgi:hypothetical protein